MQCPYNLVVEVMQYDLVVEVMQYDFAIEVIHYKTNFEFFTRVISPYYSHRVL